MAVAMAGEVSFIPSNSRVWNKVTLEKTKVPNKSEKNQFYGRETYYNVGTLSHRGR